MTSALSRRSLLLGGLGISVSWVSPTQAQAPTEGYWDFGTNTFMWDNIGGDRLKISHRAALMQPRIMEQVPVPVLEGLLSRLVVALKAPPNFEIIQDHRSNVMLSGNGWIAQSVLADVVRWRPKASRAGRVVYFRMSDRDPQYRLIHAQECNNLLIDRFDAPIVCRCEPRKGDVCGR